MITSERPGFGRSTRLPGRRFTEPADDIAAVLDHLRIDRIRVMGISGGGPHVLAFAGRHPARVIAATIVVGLAPMTEDEIDQMIDLNRVSHRLAQAGNAEALRQMYTEPAAALRTDPVAAIEKMMGDAPASDHEVMANPAWRRSFALGVPEAFAQAWTAGSTKTSSSAATGQKSTPPPSGAA